MKKTVRIICLLLLAAVALSCGNKKAKHNVPDDLTLIKQKGELTVLTLNRSTSYFNYQGEEMGFQYELAEQFARSLGVKLKIKIARNNEELITKLKNGEGDLIAYNLPYTKEDKDSVLFCGEEIITHQVIVQRNESKKKRLTNVTQLVGKNVYAKSGRYFQRLENLNKELGGGIHIHEIKGDSITVEDLIRKVAYGKINYTVADNEEAMLNKTYYENLDVSLSVSFDQRSSWAVRLNCPQLAKAATRWYKENISSSEYRSIMMRYFEISKQIQHGKLNFRNHRLSPYDHWFKLYAKRINWDWRLLAAIAYKESNFNPNVVSWAGARGLMQLMPQVARSMGIPKGKERDPQESVKGAVKCIAFLERSFSAIKDPNERLQFTLASYNAGKGHISDAMALARKYGKNPHKWKGNVAKYILLKSNEKYYNDPVCQNGYFRGIETTTFVHDVLSQYKVFKIKARK